MERHRVPPEHVDHCARHTSRRRRRPTAELVDRLPHLSLPEAVQRLVDEGTPFVLAVDAQDRARLGDAFAEATPGGAAGDDRARPAAYAALQLLLAKSVGTPYQHASEGVDGLIHDVFPSADQLDQPNTSAGATEPFSFHADKSCSAARTHSPDWVTLACVRNVEGGATHVASLRRITGSLAPGDVARLAEPDFRFGSDPTNIGPILTEGPTGRLQVRLSTDVTPLNPEADEAYRALLRAAAAVADDVVLQPGEILFLPNKACVHGRSRFTPHGDPGHRRFLQRVYIRR
ncbi:MAG: TauD/TfdA family dioxygenase [Actinomycetota bacterium]